MLPEGRGVNGEDLGPRLEVMQEPLEGFLIGVVLLPAGGVPAAARAPGLRRAKRGGIYAGEGRAPTARRGHLTRPSGVCLRQSSPPDENENRCHAPPSLSTR